MKKEFWKRATGLLLILALLVGCLTGCGAPQLESLELTLAETELDIAQTVTLQLTGSPDDAGLEGIVYRTEDAAVLVISEDAVKTGSPGQTVIWAENQDGSIQSNRIQVTVIDKQQEAENKAAAQKLQKAIESIGTVTLESESTILDVRQQYDQADKAVRSLVTNSAALTSAEKSLKEQKQAAQKAEQERLAAEKAEQERLAAEKAEQERLAAEQAERERQAAAQAEQERLAQEQAEQERQEEEQVEEESSGMRYLIGCYITEKDHRYHYTDRCPGPGGLSGFMNQYYGGTPYYSREEFISSDKETAESMGYEACDYCGTKWDE